MFSVDTVSSPHWHTGFGSEINQCAVAQVRELTAKRGGLADRRAILSNLKRKIEHSIQTATQSLNWINSALDELDKGQLPIEDIV